MTKSQLDEAKSKLDAQGSSAFRCDMGEVEPSEVGKLNGISTPKFDGWFVCVHVDNGIGTMYSRENKYRENLDWKGMNDGIYFGELIANTSWSYAFANGKYHEHVILFDILSDEPDYLKRLDIIAAQSNNFPAKVEIVRPYTGMTPTEAFDKCVKQDFEGIVVINRKEKTKVKRRYEKDYIIMGFTHSAADKYAGKMIRNLEYGDGKKVIGRLGSFKEEMRTDMFKHPEKYLGKIVTVKGKGLFSSGALRHPSFGSIRDTMDKAHLGKNDK